MMMSNRWSLHVMSELASWYFTGLSERSTKDKIVSGNSGPAPGETQENDVFQPKQRMESANLSQTARLHRLHSAAVFRGFVCTHPMTGDHTGRFSRGSG